MLSHLAPFRCTGRLQLYCCSDNSNIIHSTPHTCKPKQQINSLAITPDKKYIAAASNPTVRLYDINSKGTDPVSAAGGRAFGHQPTRLTLLPSYPCLQLISYEGHTGNVTTVGFQKDGKWMYTGSEDGTLKIWDLRASGCQRDYDCKAAVNAVALHANQAELVSGDQGGKVQIWDLTKNGFRKHMVNNATARVGGDCVGINLLWATTMATDAGRHDADPERVRSCGCFNDHCVQQPRQLLHLEAKGNVSKAQPVWCEC